MLPLKERIRHFTWAEFAFTIAGGGVATMLGEIPFRAAWLDIVGEIVFLFNLFVIALFSALMMARAYLFPRAVLRSLVHPVEAPFIPAFFLSWANVLLSTSIYAVNHTGAWLSVALRVLFWMYVAVTTLQGVLQYAWLYYYEKPGIESIGPSWLLLIFPVMLSGSIAAQIAKYQPPGYAVEIIFAGITFQALGLFVSLLIYSLLILRFSIYGLPAPSVRPGMFIMVGPMAFTGLALLGLGEAAEVKFPPGFITSRIDAGGVFMVLGAWTAALCWATCFWFFCVALVSVLAGARAGMGFRLGWCAMVFPNAGFTILTIKIGTALGSRAIQWVGTAMAPCVSAAFVACILLYVRSYVNEKIMAPDRDEDALRYSFDEEEDSNPPIESKV